MKIVVVISSLLIATACHAHVALNCLQRIIRSMPLQPSRQKFSTAHQPKAKSALIPTFVHYNNVEPGIHIPTGEQRTSRGFANLKGSLPAEFYETLDFIRKKINTLPWEQKYSEGYC